MADVTATSTVDTLSDQENHSEPKRPTQKRKRAASKPRARVKAAISVIIPIRNMAEDVPQMHAALTEGLKAYGQPYEILYVDDASTDATWQELQAVAKKDKRVKLLRMRSTFGESSAFDAGLKHAQGEKIIYAAARVRVNLAHIPKLLQKLDDGHDLVVAWRHPRQDSALNQRVSRWFNRLVQKLSKLTLHDINSSVFVTHRYVLENITFYGNLNIFIPILAAGKGFKVTEEQIEQLSGSFRQSKYVSEYIHRILDIIAVVFLTKYSKKPLHFLGFVGTIFTLAGALMSFYLFIYRILGIGPIAGRPLLLLGILLLVIGLQMISIGLIGEMIIFTHAREIKEYNIETVIGE
ncbi:MAG: glycosyltransferase [candidate division KSB1 bacterium]|nr:glycosyltransferase [candidate division KSB1 bacterium]